MRINVFELEEDTPLRTCEKCNIVSSKILDFNTIVRARLCKKCAQELHVKFRDFVDKFFGSSPM